MPKLWIERSVLINAPVETVFGAVRDFKRWPEWSPWLVTEREATLDFAADGRSYSWSGEVIGTGEVRLLDSVEYQSLNYDLSFIKPWKSQSSVRFEFAQENDGTRVKWQMDGSLPFFMFFMKRTMEGLIGMDYGRGLGMLQELIEDGSVTSELNYFPDSEYLGCRYVGIQRSCQQADIGANMESDFTQLQAWAEEQGVEACSKPSRSIRNGILRRVKLHTLQGYL